MRALHTLFFRNRTDCVTSKEGKEGKALQRVLRRVDQAIQGLWQFCFRSPVICTQEVVTSCKSPIIYYSDSIRSIPSESHAHIRYRYKPGPTATPLFSAQKLSLTHALVSFFPLPKVVIISPIGIAALCGRTDLSGFRYSFAFY